MYTLMVQVRKVNHNPVSKQNIDEFIVFIGVLKDVVREMFLLVYIKRCCS